MKDVLESLFSGYSFRSKVAHHPDGDLSVIQMKDLEKDYQEIGDSLTKIDRNSVPEKYYLQKGDVLFISKGANNFALVFNLDILAVAASAFFVLRPAQSKIIPEYLAWYINQSITQRFIEENRAGTYVPNVNKITILNIKIKTPSIKKQKLIAQIASLSIKERGIYDKLVMNRKLMVDSMLQTLIA